MEFLIIEDELRRAYKGRITTVIPYFCYYRKNSRIRSACVLITAKIVADFIYIVGVDRVITVYLHYEHIQGFFDIPIDNIFFKYSFTIGYVKKNLYNPIIVRAIAKLFNDTDIAIFDKSRKKANIYQVMNVIIDVIERYFILVDDIIDTF